MFHTGQLPVACTAGPAKSILSSPVESARFRPTGSGTWNSVATPKSLMKSAKADQLHERTLRALNLRLEDIKNGVGKVVQQATQPNIGRMPQLISIRRFTNEILKPLKFTLALPPLAKWKPASTSTRSTLTLPLTVAEMTVRTVHTKKHPS